MNRERDWRRKTIHIRTSMQLHVCMLMQAEAWCRLINGWDAVKQSVHDWGTMILAYCV